MKNILSGLVVCVGLILSLFASLIISLWGLVSTYAAIDKNFSLGFTPDDPVVEPDTESEIIALICATSVGVIIFIASCSVITILLKRFRSSRAMKIP